MRRKYLVLALSFLIGANGAIASGPGAKLYNEFLDSDALYEDHRWQDYVDRIGQKLLKHYPRDVNKDYHFFVLDNKEINAFATRDAYIFLNRGLILFLSSEDDLAAVIGHEIGHVVAGHHRKRNTKRLVGHTFGLAATLLTGRSEMMGAADSATRTMIAGYGREMELEADRIGAEFLARAGYNPLAIIDVVHVLKDQEIFSKKVQNQPTNYHGLFASHPRNDRRLHDAVAYAQSMLPEEVTDPVGDFWLYMNGIKFSDDAAGGLIRGNTYYDSDLRIVFEFPKGWAVGQGVKQVFGEAPRGREEAWISIVRHLNVSKLRPKQFLKRTLRVDDYENARELTVNEHEVFLVDLPFEEGTRAASRLALIYRGPEVYVVRSDAGSNTKVEDFENWFEELLSGVRTMTPDDHKMVQVRRISVIEARPGETFEDYASRTSLRSYPAETLRLLNGKYPNGQPRAGDYVKIVQ